MFERQAAIRAVRALIRPDYPLKPGHHRPVVVIEGGHGTGKSLLLDTLAAHADQHVPCARLDFAATPHDDTAQLLPALAGQLHRYLPRYRRLRFPRLLIALLMMEQDLRNMTFDQARATVTQLLRQRRSGNWPRRFMEHFAEAPGEGAVEIQLPFPFNLLRLPLNVVAALMGFTFPSRSQRWFGHRDRGLVGQAVDTLVDLSTDARLAREAAYGDGHGDAAARDRVARLLSEAFLADLRDCPRRVRRLNTPLLLLDNVDVPAGRAFLRRLLDARPPSRSRDGTEPLTIVTTCRETLPELAESRVGRLEDLAGQTPDEAPEWLRYPLPNLTWSDIDQLVSQASAGARVDRRLVRVVHEFTAGHPEAVGVLASTASRMSRPATSVGQLLAAPMPSDDELVRHGAEPSATSPTPSDSAGQWLLRRLLPADDPEVDALATCAAPRDEVGGLWLSHQTDVVAPSWGESVRRTTPWSPDGGRAGATVLRRLLLRRLAARPADHPTGWDAVHLRLRRRCQDTGDAAGELYHRLAMNDVAAVADELARLLPDTSGETWLTLLRSTTQAPLAVAEEPPPEPYDLYHDLVRRAFDTAATSTEARVGHLVTALRIVSDPLCGISRGFLYKQIAGTLSELAPRSPDGLVAFETASAEYGQQAQWWSL
ncbi:hypothetical protein ACTWP5_05445 [Streptomyces sp. 4N509B]|uniref:hypothetical protein n=1 Tax=Streptomyces sp. 4N509B TaxID=3457413 RepID=UPI003FD0A423